jgi:hypothetical protein
VSKETEKIGKIFRKLNLWKVLLVEISLLGKKIFKLSRTTAKTHPF